MGNPKHAPGHAKAKGQLRPDGPHPSWDEHARVVWARGKDKRAATSGEGPAAGQASEAWRRAAAAVGRRRTRSGPKTPG
jgi:hypothetical protein